MAEARGPPGAEDGPPGAGAGAGADADAVRFEDLTVDDDLPIIDRIVHYTASQIALQRLVHIKMLAETAELAGKHATQKVLIPMLAHLLHDAEAVIRQHIAGQLLTLSVVALYHDRPNHQTVETYLEETFLQHAAAAADGDDDDSADYIDDAGYELVCETVIAQYLAELIADPEVDVRRAAADSLAGLALHLKSAQDIVQYILPIPAQLAAQKPDKPSSGKKRTEEEQRMEELRITACHVLAEMGGSASEQHQQILANHNNTKEGASSSFPKNRHQEWVQEAVVPAVLQLVRDDSFRVRRAAAQALPRVMGASSVSLTAKELLPAFEKLSQDDVHRVRKSVGECLVDMSRALMILGNGLPDNADQQQLHHLRRTVLLPIADRLIQDSHKQVRQGMMQFLGPFMASFYPYQYSALHTLLPASIESDGSHHVGIVAQFFPHASSMVARLNSSQMALSGTPTPVHSSLDPFLPKPVTDLVRVQKALPAFLHAARMSALSLQAVTAHRLDHPPMRQDLQAISQVLLDYYAALSVVNTGDENTDAEMRVYCAYSFPALVLLLGRENWEGSMQTCFFTLLNPAYGQEDDEEEEEESESNNKDDTDNTDNKEGGDNDENNPNKKQTPEPPLPVKRCLASSLHTVAHILGPDLAARDILPAVQKQFLRDTDDSVRLNMIRNFPALLAVLPAGRAREEPFQIWSRVVQGDGFLAGSRKRSASNPVVLNWRQRNYLARTIPDLIQLVRPTLLQQHVWPILQFLLLDAVNDVRDDALWSVGVLLRAYCVDTVQRWKDEEVADAKRFSVDNCTTVTEWIVEHVLNGSSSSGSGGGGNGGNDTPTTAVSLSRPTNFSDRQVYCRICGSMGLALRLSEDLAAADNPKDPVSVLSSKFKSLFYNKDDNSTTRRSSSSSSRTTTTTANETGPYQRMTAAEQKHIKKLLMDDFLPHALEMKEDRISNVRITLMKVLQIMPFEIRRSPAVRPVLKTLEEEAETWTSFGDEMTTTHQADEEQEANEARSSNGDDDDEDDDDSERRGGDGPVDMDITPASSRDEDDAPPSPSKKSKASVAGKSLMSGINKKDDGLRKVMFEDGPIGMQLEPTADDSAGRVYEFNELAGGKQSPAVASGKVNIGDVIVKVNGIKVKSYDETIALLKAGGRREIAFRDGRDSDVPATTDDDAEEDAAAAAGASAAAATTSEDEDEEERRRKKKEAKEARKVKKHKKKKSSSSGGDDAASVDDNTSVDGSVDSSSPTKKSSKEHHHKGESSSKTTSTTSGDEAASAEAAAEKERRAKKKAKKAKREKEGRSKSKKSKDAEG